MRRRRLTERLAWWVKDRQFQFAFHYSCPACEVELHAWTDSPGVAASVSAHWRATHDGHEEAR